MINFLRKLVKARYETLNVVKIKAANLIANFNYLKSCQPQAEIFPILKSNAYGHGLKEVCQILNQTSAKMVAVDSFPEAQIAYRYFNNKVLLLGEMPLKAYNYTKLRRTEFIVYREETLRYLARFGKKVKIHLFVNSGMNREGVKHLERFLERNKSYLQKVSVTGFCSHLASAETDSELNKIQEKNFFDSLALFKQAGFSPRYVHLGNSAGIFTVKNELLTAYRPGLAFYGYNPFMKGVRDLPELKPALEIFSRLQLIEEIAAQETVSYNESYTANQKTRIGLIPFGYFEGLDRRLSGQAVFEILNSSGTFYAKIAGKVCMNLSCLDLKNNAAQEGDLVRIIASTKNQENSLENIAQISGAGPYETLVRIQANIRREII
jgi:alanine racemase